MTATHARIRWTGRLTGLVRSRRQMPDLTGRAYVPGDGPAAPWPAAEGPVRPDAAGWDLTGQAAYLSPQPGSLGGYYAAEEIRGQQATATITRDSDDHSDWYGLTQMDVPPAQPRRYVPESVPLPEPEPQPEPVIPAAVYPLPDLHADLAECPIFRDAVRGQFVRQERAKGNSLDGHWGQVYAEVFERRTALVWGVS